MQSTKAAVTVTALPGPPPSAFFAPLMIAPSKPKLTTPPVSVAEPGHIFKTLKTIFIIVDSGMAIRNILRTDVFAILKRCRNLKIVIFSPLSHDPEFQKEVAGENITLEPLQQWKAGPLVKSIRSLRKDVWSDKHDVIRFKEKRASKKSRLGRALVYGLLRDGSPDRVDSALAKLDRWEARLTPALAGDYFDRYQPDLIFYSTIYSKDLSIEIGARQRGVKSCAYILSWDNPTTKGPFPVRPDRAIVWNNIMRDELLSYHEFPPADIFVAGTPQFDIYYDSSRYLSRESFFEKWQLDPAKRLITYTTGAPALFPFEHEIVESLYQRLQKGALRQPAQLMVRVHPKDLYDIYKRFEGKPDLVLQLAGRKGKTDDTWNPSRQDMFELGETMKYSDVVLNIVSTTTIDAACFDTPVVNIAFDGRSYLPYEKSCKRFYNFNHYKKIVETGGVVIANNLNETITLTQRYFDDPRLEAEGRARIREEQCYQFDGHAGERIANYLIDYLES